MHGFSKPEANELMRQIHKFIVRFLIQEFVYSQGYSSICNPFAALSFSRVIGLCL